MLSGFHLIPERHGQTDGRSDGRTEKDRFAISISRVSQRRLSQQHVHTQTPVVIIHPLTGTMSLFNVNSDSIRAEYSTRNSIKFSRLIGQKLSVFPRIRLTSLPTRIHNTIHHDGKKMTTRKYLLRISLSKTKKDKMTSYSSSIRVRYAKIEYVSIRTCLSNKRSK